MSIKNENNYLAYAASKAKKNPEYIGYFLHRYAEIESIQLNDLINYLNCSIASFNRLSLCLAPDANSSSFAESIKNISTTMQVSYLDLAKIIKHVIGIEALRVINEQEQDAILLAARDSYKSNSTSDSSDEDT